MAKKAKMVQKKPATQMSREELEGYLRDGGYRAAERAEDLVHELDDVLVDFIDGPFRKNPNKTSPIRYVRGPSRRATPGEKKFLMPKLDKLSTQFIELGDTFHEIGEALDAYYSKQEKK